MRQRFVEVAEFVGYLFLVHISLAEYRLAQFVLAYDLRMAGASEEVFELDLGIGVPVAANEVI